MRPSVVIGAAAALAAPAALPAAAPATSVKAPRDGQYEGKRNFFMLVSGKNVDIVAFDFPCGKAKGRISLNDIDLRKTKKGYKFSVEAHGNVTYSDNHPDENAASGISGQFNRKGRKPHGRLQAISPRCGNTGKLDWKASRTSSSSSR
jgi:hypothetical protein